MGKLKEVGAWTLAVVCGIPIAMLCAPFFLAIAIHGIWRYFTNPRDVGLPRNWWWGNGP